MSYSKELTKAAKGTCLRFAILMAVLAALLSWGLILNVNIGSVHIDAREVFSLVGRGLRAWLHDAAHGGSTIEEILSESTNSRIILSIRMPRMMMAAILGGSLALSGFLLQTFFRNPIAGPFVLGISSGAKMIVGIAMIFLAPKFGALSSSGMVIAAFIGSLTITLFVLLFSQRVKNMAMLLVVGTMVGYICSAVTDFAITFASEYDVVNLTHWSLGSFSGAAWDKVGTALLFAAIGFLASILLSKPIGAYALGEGYAKSMGIPIKAVRVAIIVVSSLLSASVTALAGPISFVGIAVPHIAKSMLRTSKPIFVIPATFLCGSVFTLYCDLLARTAFSPTELAIGTVTSIFGAPVVIYMMVQRKKGTT